jgi:hypothetical protein
MLLGKQVFCLLRDIKEMYPNVRFIQNCFNFLNFDPMHTVMHCLLLSLHDWWNCKWLADLLTTCCEYVISLDITNVMSNECASHALPPSIEQGMYSKYFKYMW